MLAVSNVVSLSNSGEHSGVTAESLPSDDSITLIVHSLMCYRQNGETQEFAKKAIESLVRKLKEKPQDLDSLLCSIRTNGANPGRCVTIQRTLDGRMQIAGRKCLPHFIFSKIWRWPDLHRNELKHSVLCAYGFDMKKDLVCVNPYHYERLVSPVDFGSLSLSPADDHTTLSDSDSGLPEVTAATANGQSSHVTSISSYPSPTLTDIVGSSSPTQRFRNNLSVQTLLDNDIAHSVDSPSPASHTPISSGLSALSRANSTRDHVNPAPHPDRGRSTMAWSGVAIPHASRPDFDFVPPSTSSSSVPTGYKAWSQATSNLVNFRSNTNLSGILNSSGNEPTGNSNNSNSNPHNQGGTSGTGATNQSSSCSNFTTPGGSVSGGSNAAAGGWNQRGGPPQPPFTPSGSLLQPVPVLTTQRPPEFWCNIAYFELDQQVGELFKVPSHYSRVTVDGYTDPSSPNRFCLGQLSNVHRSEQSERSRLYIGKGVELDNVGEGDVWIRCLSEFSVFVQSYYLDREAGRRPGDAVHKIYPGAYIKVFDIRQCHEQMKLLAHSAQIAAEHQAAVVVGSLPSPGPGSGAPPSLISPPPLPPGPSQSNSMQTSPVGMSSLATADVGVDDLRRLCMLRLSFVKGWGPDYPRRSIKETPCWIEIQLHRPLQLLDEVLQGMPLNDRKPTRHFFPYFTQPGTCPVPRPTPSSQTNARRS